MKKLLAILLMLFLFSDNSNATHLMGGEITWVCIKDTADEDFGKYIFTVKVYRDCQGVNILTDPSNLPSLIVHNHPTLFEIPLSYFGITDLSPLCDAIDSPNSPFSCNGTNLGYSTLDDGAVEEHVYESEAITINGTPNDNGWHFTYSNIARNLAIINLANNTCI